VTHLDKIVEFSEKRRFIVAYGDNDPPEFKRQSTEFNSVSTFILALFFFQNVSMHFA
jgi:hypothetical protein